MKQIPELIDWITRIAALVIASVALTAPAKAAPILLTPTDDGLVLTAPTSPTNRSLENWGGHNALEVFAGFGPGPGLTGGAIDFSFLRFDLSSIAGPASSIRLHLEVTNILNPTSLSLFRVANDSWAEGTGVPGGPFGLGPINTSPDPLTGITGSNFGNSFLNNLNKGTDTLATVNVSATGPLVIDFSGFDVSSDLADGFLTLALAFDDVPAFTGGAFKQIGFSSKEGNSAPQLEFDGVAAVPEPSSLALFGIGGVVLLGYGWRRHGKPSRI